MKPDWNELEANLNSIGGTKMEKPSTGGIDTIIEKQMSIDDFWVRLRHDFDVWFKNYKLSVDMKLRNAQVKVIELENQKNQLGMEIIRLRKKIEQVAEYLGKK